jgi:O-antigen ligase
MAANQNIYSASYVIVLVTMVFTIMAYGAVHQPMIGVYYILVAVAALLVVGNVVRKGQLTVSRHPIQLPLVLLALYALIQLMRLGRDGSALTLDPFSTQMTAVNISVLALFFAISLLVLNSAGRIRNSVGFLIIFGFVYGFYAILQSVLSPDKIYGIYQPGSATPFGSFVNRHNFAAIMEMTAAVPLGMLYTGALKNERKMLIAVAAVLMISALLLSGSRGGLVAFIAQLIALVLVATKSRGYKQMVLRLGMSALLVVAAVAGAIFVGGETSLTRIGDSAGSEDVTSSRSHIWAVTWDVIVEHFPLGAGLGAFGQAYAAKDTSGGYFRVEQAHNDYLQIAADAGIVGIILGLAFLIFFLRAGWRSMSVKNGARRGVAVGAFAGCAAILIHSIFDFVLHIPAVALMFLFLMALMVACGRDYEDDSPEFDADRKSIRRADVRPIVKKRVAIES